MDPMDQTEQKNQYGVLKIQSPPPTDSGTSSDNTAQYSPFSFSNPVYEPTTKGTGPTYKVEDVVVRMRSVYGSNYSKNVKAWGGVKSK